MKDEATPEQIEMARRLYANYGATKAVEAGDMVDDAWMAAVLDGDADKTHGVQIALAAIIETQRLDAELAEDRYLETDWQEPGQCIADAIRSGSHLKGHPHD